MKIVKLAFTTIAVLLAGAALNAFLAVPVRSSTWQNPWSAAPAKDTPPPSAPSKDTPEAIAAAACKADKCGAGEQKRHLQEITRAFEDAVKMVPERFPPRILKQYGHDKGLREAARVAEASHKNFVFPGERIPVRKQFASMDDGWEEATKQVYKHEQITTDPPWTAVYTIYTRADGATRIITDCNTVHANGNSTDIRGVEYDSKGRMTMRFERPQEGTIRHVRTSVNPYKKYELKCDKYYEITYYNLAEPPVLFDGKWQFRVLFEVGGEPNIKPDKFPSHTDITEIQYLEDPKFTRGGTRAAGNAFPVAYDPTEFHREWPLLQRKLESARKLSGIAQPFNPLPRG